MYRAFRHKASGRWLTATITTSKPRFGIAPSVHAEQVAPAYGLAATALDVVDGDSDPRTGILLFPRPPQVPAHVAAMVESILADVESVLPLSPVALEQLRERLTDRLSGRI